MSEAWQLPDKTYVKLVPGSFLLLFLGFMFAFPPLKVRCHLPPLVCVTCQLGLPSFLCSANKMEQEGAVNPSWRLASDASGGVQ